MEAFIAPAAALVAGAVGGLLNAGMSGSGVIELPGTGTDKVGKVVRLGWIGNCGIGAVAALVSWALYGAAATKSIVSAVPTDMSWAAFGAAILVGIGGSRWLSAEVDKRIFQKTAEVAATKEPDPALAATISSASPADALRAAVAK